MELLATTDNPFYMFPTAADLIYYNVSPPLITVSVGLSSELVGGNLSLPITARVNCSWKGNEESAWRVAVSGEEDDSGERKAAGRRAGSGVLHSIEI
jgi:hypothetical protein